MIVSTKSLRISPKATPIGKRAGHTGSIYTIGKRFAEYAGYAKDIQPYLPETYIDKYTYKPQKRLSGYVGQKIHKPKTKTSYSKFGKTRSRFFGYNSNSHCSQTGSKSGYCTKQYS